MFPSLETKLKRFEELEKQLQDPAVLSDNHKLVEIQREYGGLKKVADSVREFHQLQDDISAAEEMLAEETDAEAKEYAQAELSGLQKRRDEMQGELEELALSGDSITRGGLIMEIRAGAGGDEAALFAGDLFNMYSRLVENRGWKMEVMESNASDLGGFKEITFSVTGEGAYHQLQFESGGHRVQRVPETEAQGRIHTSAATVAVLPEASAVEIDIRDDDLQIDTMRPAARAARRSTRPRVPSASHTCRPESSSSARTRRASTRTRRRRCGCFARGCSSTSSGKRTKPVPRSDGL